MSSKWSAYFDKTQPENYRFLHYYEYWSKQSNFTSFQNESRNLKKDLERLLSHGSGEMKAAAARLHSNLTASFFFIIPFCMAGGKVCFTRLGELYPALAL